MWDRFPEKEVDRMLNYYGYAVLNPEKPGPISLNGVTSPKELLSGVSSRHHSPKGPAKSKVESKVEAQSNDSVKVTKVITPPVQQPMAEKSASTSEEQCERPSSGGKVSTNMKSTQETTLTPVEN